MANSSVDPLLNSAVNECLKGKFTLKPQQFHTISSILKGLDTLCVLLTGFGKSLIYQLLPPLFKKIVNASELYAEVTRSRSPSLSRLPKLL